MTRSNEWNIHSEKKLNIIEVCFSQSKGGLELYMARISRLLQNCGHSITAVVSPDSFLEQTLRESKVSVVTIKNKLKYLDLAAAIRLSRVIRQKKTEVIHCHQSRDRAQPSLLLDGVNEERCSLHPKWNPDVVKKIHFITGFMTKSTV